DGVVDRRPWLRPLDRRDRARGTRVGAAAPRGPEARLPGRMTDVVGLYRGAAELLDERDPLRDFRDRFILDEDSVYLDGNSLGSLPRSTAERLRRVVSDEWGIRGIRGWEEGWLDLPLVVGDRLAAAALGAASGQT